MWRKGRSILIGLLFVILIVYLGFLRDFVFKNINYYIKVLYFNIEHDYYPWIYIFLKNLSIPQLLNLKWIMTLVFVLLNYLFSVIILKRLFSNAALTIRLISLGYIVLFIISGIFYVGGNLFDQAELGYTLARRFMGVLQSPVPLMVVASVHLLFGSSSENQQ